MGFPFRGGCLSTNEETIEPTEEATPPTDRHGGLSLRLVPNARYCRGGPVCPPGLSANWADTKVRPYKKRKPSFIRLFSTTPDKKRCPHPPGAVRFELSMW